MDLISQKVMNYRINQKIGEGGMGSVYVATHELMNSKAAIKVLHPAMGADPQLRNRFLTEASTLSAMNHPYIVRVLDFTESEQGLFIIMEYVEGLPLNELIKKTGPMPEERAFKIFDKLLSGFQYAHSRKPAIIHRDIKPSNIIINEDDEPKIIDFGIVKIMDKAAVSHTMVGTKVGTPVYMSPEQIYGQELDNRSDIYSLGITLFTVLTGRSPYENTLSEFEIQEKIIRAPLPRAKDIFPGVSDRAQAIIDKATAKAREDRFNNCEEFRQALKDSGSPVIQPAAAKTFDGEATMVVTSPPPVKPAEQPATNVQTSIPDNEATMVLSNVQPSSPVKPPVPPVPSSQIPVQPQPAPKPVMPGVAKKKTKINPALIIGGVLVLILIVFFVYRSNKSTSRYSSPTSYKPNSFNSSDDAPTLTESYLKQKIVDYFRAEASGSFSKLREFYSPFMTRFYQDYTPSISEIRSAYEYTWTVRINIQCDVKYVQKYSMGTTLVKAIATLDYSFYDVTAQKYEYLKDAQTTFVFDQKGKITAVY